MRVLIVENQPERLAMLVPALEAAGCVVTATLNSARSLDVQIQALRPDVVIRTARARSSCSPVTAAPMPFARQRRPG